MMGLTWSKRTTKEDVKPCPLGEESPWKPYWDGISRCFVFRNKPRPQQKKELFLNTIKLTTIPYKVHEYDHETTIWLET